MKKEDKPFEEWKFARKRDEWMRRLASVPQSEISSGAKLVAFRLSLYMRERRRRAFPGYEELAACCGMSERIVQEHTKTVANAGWLDVERKRNQGNTYWLKYPFVQEDGYVIPLPKRADSDLDDDD